MATELRRSSRARKQVKSYAEEQAEAEEQTAIVKPRTVRKMRSKVQVDDYEYATQNTGDADPDDDFEIDQEPPKKRGRKSKKPQSAQLYDLPAEGTMIEWGSRTRKQPKIYEVPKNKSGNTGVKKDAWLNDAAEERIAREQAKIRKLAPGEKETRLRVYQDELPDWYEAFLNRAATQKMCVLERTRDVEHDCHANHEDCPFETLKVVGSTGSVYTVRISHLTVCTCPVVLFSRTGSEKQCKHVLYVLHHVLRAPEHLAYQAAFLTSELKELFANAPPLPTQVAEEDVKDGNRKEVSGECPICFMDFEEGEDVTWCKAACGNNIHKGCFDKWAAMKHKVSCPFCRTEWQYEDKPKAQRTTLTKVKDLGNRDRGGYVNVADQLAALDDDDD